MSPRRKIDPDAGEVLAAPAPKPRGRWRFPVVVSLAVVLVAGAIVASTLILLSRESHRRQSINDIAVLGYVRSFMIQYTSLDPSHANDYADRILAQGTGDFAKSFKQKENLILLEVARTNPTTGTVTEAGVEKWNSDGSANVLVAVLVTAKSTDGKTVSQSANRWVATATKEGQQWKISQLMQVI